MTGRIRRRRIAARFQLAVLLAAIVYGWSLFQPSAGSRAPVTVDVPDRVGVRDIARLLQARGVIRSAWAFDAYVYWRRADTRLRAGRHLLSPGMTLRRILQELEAPAGPSPAEVRVTIPEGYTLDQVAAALGSRHATDAAMVRRLATSPEAIRQMQPGFPLPQRSLEGYLFPDTYYFMPGTPASAVLDTMLADFRRKFVQPYLSQVRQSGHTLPQIVTEASLVEREARIPADRPRIAGVLDNRLKRHMPLQVDATILYALGRREDRVLDRDLKVKSPYNTYLHAGLPPAPIANPGLASLLATLHPAKTDFLYYVATPTGAHIFSRTLTEHEAARRRVDLMRRAAESAPVG